MKKDRKTNESRGITLIALIVTIIVLLILAGISIAMLTGQNGILNKAAEGRQESVKGQAKDEVSLAVNNLMIEDKLKNLTQEQKRTMLENDVKKYKEDSTVEISGTGFLIKHRGYEFEVSNTFQIVEKEPFVAEKWDEKAASEDVFIWQSDDSSNAGYGIVIGYNAGVQNYSTLRYPSRCTEVQNSRLANDGQSTETIRSYTKNIKEIELPDTVTKIGKGAFYSHGDNLFGYFFDTLKKINIPNGVTSIGENAFRECTELTSIIIPGSATSTGAYAFKDCTGLTNITILDGVTSITYNSFEGCTGVTNVTIPSSITEIGNNAFLRCTRLNNLVIPEGVTSIGNSAFSDCIGIENITIPGSVKTILTEAFKNCTGLKKVTILEGITEIYYSVFSGCTGLTSVTIPNSVITIRNGAFGGCTSLNDLKVPESVTSIEDGAFYGVPHITYNGTATGSPWGATAIN